MAPKKKGKAQGGPASKKAKVQAEHEEEAVENDQMQVDLPPTILTDVPVDHAPLLADDDGAVRRLRSILLHKRMDLLREAMAAATEREHQTLLADNPSNILWFIIHSHAADASEILRQYFELLPRNLITPESLLPTAQLNLENAPIILDQFLSDVKDREAVIARLISRAIEYGQVESVHLLLARLVKTQSAAASLPRGRSFVGSGNSKDLVPTAEPSLVLHELAHTAADASALPKTLLNSDAINFGALNNYWTPVHLSCLNPNGSAVLAAFVQNKADLTVDSISGFQPLHVAAAAPSVPTAPKPNVRKGKAAADSLNLDLPSETSPALAYLLSLPDEEDFSPLQLWNNINKLSPLSVAIRARRPANVTALILYINAWNAANSGTGRATASKLIQRRFEQELNLAVTVSDAQTLTALLNDPPTLEFAKATGQTLLEAATAAGNVYPLVQLVAAGVKIEKPSVLLRNAIDAGSLELVQLLIKSYGADPTAIVVPETGASALHRAVELGFTAAAEFLLDHKANPLARTANRVSVLMTATRSSRTSCLKLLVKRGINVNATEKQLKAAEEAAAAMETTQKPAEAVTAIPSGPPFAGMVFVVTGVFKMSKYRVAEVIRDNGGVVSETVTGKVTHIICGEDGITEYGQPTGTKSKKYKEAKKKRLPVFDEAKIMEAVQKYQGVGYHSVVDRVVGKKEDIDQAIEVEAEETANVLMDMISFGISHQSAPATVAFLLSVGVDISFVDGNGRTALHVLVETASENDATVATLDVLIDAMNKWHQDNPQKPSLTNALDERGYNGLLLAATQNKWRFVGCLLKAPEPLVNYVIPFKTPEPATATRSEDEGHEGKDVKVLEPVKGAGYSLLQVLVQNNQHALAARVIELGADVNYVAVIGNDRSPVLLTALSGSLDCVLLLLSQPSLQPHAVNAHGQTLLHVVTRSFPPATVQDALHQILLATGGNFHNGLELQDKNGFTPLHWACQQTSMSSCARLLVMKGVEIDPRAKDGSTPLMLAVQHSYFDTALFLIDHGADLNIKVTLPHRGTVSTLYQCVATSLPLLIDTLFESDKFNPLDALPHTVYHTQLKRLCKLAKKFATSSPNANWSSIIKDLLFRAVNNDWHLFTALIPESSPDMFASKNNNGETLLFLSANDKDFLKIVRVLELSPKDALLQRDAAGRSILHRIVAQDDPNMFLLFIGVVLRAQSQPDSGINLHDLINNVDNHGTTPLLIALNKATSGFGIENRFPFIAWLILAGADPLWKQDANSPSACSIAGSLHENVAPILLSLLQGEHIEHHLTIENNDAVLKKYQEVNSLEHLASLTFQQLSSVIKALLPPIVLRNLELFRAEFNRGKALASTKAPSKDVKQDHKPQTDFAACLTTAVEFVLSAPPKLSAETDKLAVDVKVDHTCPNAFLFKVAYDTANHRYHHYQLIQEQDNGTNYVILQVLERLESATPRKPMPKYRVFQRYGALGDVVGKKRYLDHVDLASAVADLKRQFTERTGDELENIDKIERIRNKYVPVVLYHDLYEKTPTLVTDHVDPNNTPQVELHRLIRTLTDTSLTSSSDWSELYDRLRMPSGFSSKKQLETAIKLILDAEKSFDKSPEALLEIGTKLIEEVFLYKCSGGQRSLQATSLIPAVNSVRSISKSALAVAVQAATLLVERGQSPLTAKEADWKSAIQLLLSVPSHQVPVHHIIDHLPCKLEYVPSLSAEFSLIYKYAEVPIQSLFRVHRFGEAAWTAEAGHKSRLLWYHANDELATLINGVHPVTDRDVPLAEPFGRSMVFSEGVQHETAQLIESSFSPHHHHAFSGFGYHRSYGYHAPTKKKFVFLCAVNVGTSHKTLIRKWKSGTYDDCAIPAGADSVISYGKEFRSDDDSVLLQDGVIVPVNGPVSANRRKDPFSPERLNINFQFAAFAKTHYALNDPARVSLRYIVQL